MNDKLDTYLDTLGDTVKKLKPNFDVDWGSGAFHFKGLLKRRHSDGQPKSTKPVWVWATPYWEGHDGIPFAVETELGEYPDEFQKDVVFPESEITYDLNVDAARYIKVVTDKARVLGIYI